MHKYTPAELRFLKNKGAGKTLAELTDLFNKRFDLSVTTSQVSSVCACYKMNFGRIHKYTKTEIRFLEKNVAGRSYAELTEMFNKRFGLDFTRNRIQSTLHRLGLANGRDGRFRPGSIPPNKGRKGYCPEGCKKSWFKPGHRPANKKPVGTERINADGYVDVRIRNPSGKRHKNWKAKHRIIWETANGRKVPRCHAVIFADGNKLNFALNNLLPVSRSELAVMNRLGLISNNEALTRAGKTAADIKLKIAELRRKAKKSGEPRGGQNRQKRGGGK